MFRKLLHWAMSLAALAWLGAGSLGAQSSGSPRGNQVLVVWKVGPPYSNQTPDSTIPPGLERKAEGMGLRLQIRAMTGSDFAQEFPGAFAARQAPDVIAAENAFTIDAPDGYKYGAGIASNPEVRRSLIQVYGSLDELAGPRGGKQFLVSTSQHAETARRFALRPPECDAIAGTPAPRDLEQTAVQIADDYLSAPEKANAYDDRDRLLTEGSHWTPVNTGATAACGWWGNDRLAFVPVLATFERTGAPEEASRISWTQGPLLGQMPVLLVLRRQEGQWRLLAASKDPVSTGPFLQEIPLIAGLLRRPGDEEADVAPAEILAPEDGKVPAPDADQRFGDFLWQPSSSGNVVAQIVEFAYENDDRLFFAPMGKHAVQDRLSAGLLWNTGGGWKWRVWSISGSGAIAFSESRTFRH